MRGAGRKRGAAGRPGGSGRRGTAPPRPLAAWRLTEPLRAYQEDLLAAVDPADGATGRAEDDPHANADGADGATVVESAPTGRTATVHNLTIHGLTNYYITTTTGTRALVHNEYGTQVPYDSTDLSSAVAQARFEDGVRQGKNYAAARMRIRGAENAEDVIEVVHSLGKNQHAEPVLAGRAKEMNADIVELFTEREPCANSCGPLLTTDLKLGQNAITYAVPWNPSSVRPQSNRELKRMIREDFDARK